MVNGRKNINCTVNGFLFRCDPVLFYVSAFVLSLLVRIFIPSSTSNRNSNDPFKGDEPTF